MLVLLALVISYCIGFVFTFLYGSSWLLNSSYTLAIFPSLFSILIISVVFYLTRSKTGVWKIIDYFLMSFTCLALVTLGGSFLGIFSANKKSETGNFIESDGVSIYYHQSSPVVVDKPTVLVLHGGPGSGSYATRAELSDSLDQDFNMIYFDQRGCGRSSWAKSFMLDDYINDMENLRKKLNIDSWYLFGTSWGAVLANEYAARYPERVKGIINWGGLISSQPETKEMIRHIISFYEANNENKKIASWKKLLDQQSPYNRFQTFRTLNRVNRLGLKSIYDQDKEIESILTFRHRAMKEWGYEKNELGANLWVTLVTIMQLNLEDYDFSPRLKEINHPYLFLAGDHDPQMNRKELDRYKKSMSHASVEIVENSGHLFDNPGEMIAQIRSFLKNQPTE